MTDLFLAARRRLSFRPAYILLLIAAVVLCAEAVAQSAADATSTGEPARPEELYGLWTLTPAVVAIVLAMISRQVVIALTVGVLTAAWMMLPCLAIEDKFGASGGIIAAVRVAFEGYVLHAVADRDHVKIMMFTLIIGAMVGVVSASGGTSALVSRVAGAASTSRRGQLTGWGAGLVVFFDDYANSMIVGPTMRPIFDRLKISRAKLAYIVDSTAAPVASIALIGTWVGAEVGFINDGFAALGDNVPAFLHDVTAYDAFLYSIPHRFYPLFALALVFVIALTGRDFGPMRRHEARALQSETTEPADRQGEPTRPRGWWLAGLPILVLVGMTMAIIVISGYANAPAADADEGFFDRVQKILSNADPYASILYAAVCALTLAMLLATSSKALSLRGAMDAAMAGMSRMFPAIVVLILAWSLSGGMKDLRLGLVATQRLQEAQFAPGLLPMAVFISACVVSFATGTSWGTMGILCPVVVTISAGLAADLPTDEALSLFYGSVGSVLAGAVFGDHCSPISDTTVLSALASECSLEDHVWTQVPYAVLAAVMELVAGDLLCGYIGAPWWLGLALGVIGLILFVWAAGRPVRRAPATMQ